MKLFLHRGYYGETETLGMLFSRDVKLPPIYTLELPWKENRRRISCIPAGSYRCMPYDGSRFKNVWELQNVPDRDAILIHAGNLPSDILGYILVGLDHGELKGKKAVLRSKAALDILRKEIGRKSFELTIL